MSEEQQAVDEIIAREQRMAELSDERQDLEEMWDGARGEWHYHAKWIENRLDEIESEMADIDRWFTNGAV